MSATKSKTATTWLALLGGGFGLHRFYLHGVRDYAGWLHLLPTLLGLKGLQRVLELGMDDNLAAILMPLAGISISAAMISALYFGLMADERWNSRYNAHAAASAPSGWATVIGVVLALFIGGIVLVSTLSFGMQRFFESQVEASRELSQ